MLSQFSVQPLDNDYRFTSTLYRRKTIVGQI